MQRFFTSDFHFSMPEIIDFEKRPFKNVGEMNAALTNACLTAKPEDVIIHVGDLFTYKSGIKPSDMIGGIKAMFVNIRGNHDLNNKVKSLCDSMRTNLGRRFPNVSVSHYPTYDRHCAGHFENGQIHICGHVHSKWKHCVDMDHQCLNVNVGVDVWNYRIVSEDELIRYIDRLLKHRPDELFRCRMSEKGLVFLKGK